MASTFRDENETKQATNMKQTAKQSKACCLFYAVFLLGFIFNTEDGSTMLLRTSTFTGLRGVMYQNTEVLYFD
jgi:hypothetical protein